MSNMTVTEFFEAYKNLSVPEGLSKSKRGFFEGTVDTVKKILSGKGLSTVRAKNLAINWSKIMGNQSNLDVYQTALDAGFDQNFWNKFAELGDVDYSHILVQRTQKKKNRERRRQNRGAHFVAHLLMNVGEETTNDKDQEVHQITTTMVDLNEEGCYLRRIYDSDGLYGFNLPHHLLEEFFKHSDSEMEGEHLFRIEWWPDRKKREGFYAKIAGLSEETEATHTPLSQEEIDNRRKARQKSRRKRVEHKIVHRQFIPMNVSQNEDETWQVTTPPFELEKNEDGKGYSLGRVSDTLRGFRNIPDSVIANFFDDSDCDMEGNHTFEVLWKKKFLKNGKDKIYAIIGSLNDDVETSIEYVDPKKLGNKSYQPRRRYNSKKPVFSKSVLETRDRILEEQNKKTFKASESNISS